ncbi:MAG TPA: phosphatidylserine decarboxylase [Methylomirabilota bacterium]|nr:phosphatidylserine decarboxylase [Methylomirabilota bacterium]
MSEEIRYFNRYSGKMEKEEVYGLGFLRWTYGNPIGKMSLHGLVKRTLFSRWYGKRMDDPESREKVLPFIEQYRLNAAEFADPPESYKTFNEFFYRKLKPGARPIDPNPKAAVFPADGRHMGFQNISEAPGIFVKGALFTLAELFRNEALAAEYKNGSIVLSRLCPVDYHRYHFPISGKAGKTNLIEGPLYSVNPIALRQNIRILCENKRAWTRIESDVFGPVMMFEVGATCVGSFEYTYQPDSQVEKGAEKGYFRFGGSLTITLFKKGRIRLADDLVKHSSDHVELYARMGDTLGEAA